MTRTTTVRNQYELENRVDDYARDGWGIVEKDDGEARLRTRDYGGWVAHLLLLLFTAGLGNIPYAIYRFFSSKEEVVIRVE